MLRTSVLLLVLVAAFGSASPLEGSANRARKPNMIVIYTDDHGWPDIGVAGVNQDLRTPHLDKLAAVGVYATNGYSTAPQCVPSRAGLLTGKAQNRFGVESNGVSLAGFNAERTIAERLKAAGYATGQIGKWHLGPTQKIAEHGFDDVYSKNANRPCHANYKLSGETIPMQLVDDGLYHLDACSRAAETFIRRHADEPFFLYLAYRAPHVPLDAPKRYLDRFPGKMPERRRQALAMISAMDDGVGLIRKTLAAHELEKDTLIFYIGDNGAPLKIHKLDAPGGGPGWDGSLNEPMNGEKGMLSEGGIRVPFILAWPGTIPARQTYDHPISALDVAATSLAIAGVTVDAALDGENLVPYLSGEKSGAPHDELYWRWIAQSAIREGKWKLLRGGQREYLFDLESDREEKTNLLASQPEVASRLRKKLTSWAQELQPPGLGTKAMSAVWEQYFDYYLDGKPTPPPRAQSRSPGSSASVRGWICRNAKLSTDKFALHVRPTGRKSKQSPFLVMSKLDVHGPVKAKVQLSTEKPGKVGIAWRLRGQKDFRPSQVSRVDAPLRPDWQEIEVDVPATGTIIHVRLHLPPGRTSVRRIELLTRDGKTLRDWSFVK